MDPKQVPSIFKGVGGGKHNQISFFYTIQPLLISQEERVLERILNNDTLSAGVPYCQNSLRI